MVAQSYSTIFQPFPKAATLNEIFLKVIFLFLVQIVDEHCAK